MYRLSDTLCKLFIPLLITATLFSAAFANSNGFVDGDIKTRWYAVLLLLGVMGISSPLWRPVAFRSWFVWVAWAVVFVALLQSGYGVLQFIGILPGHRGFRVVGNFDNPAGYAAMLACSVPFVLHWAFTEQGWRRGVAWGVCVLVGIALLLSGSRAGVLSAMVVVGLWSVRQSRRRWPLWMKCIGVLSVIVFLCGIYILKKDSADGRILIWRCAADMIVDKPLFGHGYGSFDAEYMLYQARYFEQNPESNFASLADNVKHPFNEFLLLAVEFGLVGLGLVVCGIIGLLRLYARHRTVNSFTGVTVLVAVFVFSLFSYPFKYPFTWLASVYGCVVLLSSLKPKKKGNAFINYFLC